MNRVFFLGIVIYVLLVLALAGTNGILLAMMLPFMVYLGVGFFFSPDQLNLDINRQLSRERSLPGEEIIMRVTITNLGPNIELMNIEDQLPEGLQVIDGNTSLLTQLSSGKSITLNYKITGSRGLYHFGKVKITASDNLIVRTKTTVLITDEQLFIQPKPLRLGRLDIRPRRTRVYAGHIPARIGGSGVEFFGVREYQQGDPLRWINWRASARLSQKFFINEFEQERVADVGIILDTRLRSQIVADNGETLFEFSVQAASALAETFIKDGNRVGLLLYGTLLDWTFPDYGKIQRERILKRLSIVQPGESLVFDELDNLPKNLLPHNSQIVFISPLHESDLKVLIGLRARGYAVMVISPNPIRFEQTRLQKPIENIVTASRLAELERILMLKKLQQAGIQILNWNTAVELDQAIAAALSHRTHLLQFSI
jgi:uncharacterized protein (DUF58 family)